MEKVSRTGFSGFPDPVDPEKRIRPFGVHQEAKTFHLRYYMEKVSRTGFSGFPDPVDPENRIRPFSARQEAKTFHLRYNMKKVSRTGFSGFTGSGTGNPESFLYCAIPHAKTKP